jgi:hypothetical protein
VPAGSWSTEATPAAARAFFHAAVRRSELLDVEELEYSGLADDLERLLGVIDAGKLDADLVRTLPLYLGLSHSQSVHPVLDDPDGLVHLVGDGLPALVVLQDDR